MVEEEGYCSKFKKLNEIICGNCQNFSKKCSTHCLAYNEDFLQELDEEYTNAFPVKIYSSMQYCDEYIDKAV